MFYKVQFLLTFYDSLLSSGFCPLHTNHAHQKATKFPKLSRISHLALGKQSSMTEKQESKRVGVLGISAW